MTSKIPKNVTILRGETESGEPVAVAQPRRRKRVKGWRDRIGAIDFTLMAKLRLNGTQQRVLFTVMAYVPPKNGRIAYCTQADIAERTGIHRVEVAKTLAQLRDRHIVWNVRQGCWAVSAWLMYNGDYDSWSMECEEDQEPIWTRIDPKTGEIL